MAQLSPITGAPFISAQNHRTVLTRHLLLAGDQIVRLRVKVVEEGCIYIVAEEVVYNRGDEERRVKRGSFLTANYWQGSDGRPKYAVYDDLFDLMRAVAEHIVDSESVELRTLDASSGNLLTVLALTWSVRKSSPDEEQDRVRDELTSFVLSRGKWQNENKLEAFDFASRAAARVGDIPFPALSPMIGAAMRRLDNRRDEVREIVGRISRRQVAVFRVFDWIWKFRGWLENEFNAMLARFDSKAGYFDKRSVSGMIRRLGNIAHYCENVSAAPFGRRTFAHIAVEVRYAAALLEYDQHIAAAAALDRSLRSLFLLTLKREIVDLMVVILALKRLNAEPNSDFYSGLEAIEAYLVDGFDRDFETPIVRKVRENIELVIQIPLVGDSVCRLDLAYALLREAQAPI